MRHARLGSTHWSTNTRAWTGLNCRIGAKHANTRTELGTTKRDHMLANVLSNDLAVLWVGVRQDVLDQVVAILVAGDVNEWDARAVVATFADTIEIAAKEVNTADLKALFNNF